jgi:hypothetical protein
MRSLSSQSKGLKRASRKTALGEENAGRRKTRNKQCASRTEQSPPSDPSEAAVSNVEPHQLTPIVSPRRTANDFPTWHQHPQQQRSNSFGGLSGHDPSVVSLPSPSHAPYNEAFGSHWTHRRVSYPYHQAHRSSLHSQDMEIAPVWSSSEDGLGSVSSLPPVSPSSVQGQSIWRASQYEHGRSYPPALPTLQAWSSDSGLQYHHGIHQSHSHPVHPPSWRPLPHYGHESLGAPPLVASNRLNLPNPMVDDSPAPFVIRRSGGGGNRFVTPNQLPSATHLDFTPPPSPFRKRKECHGAAEAGGSSPHFAEKALVSTNPLMEVEASSKRTTQSPSEITEENDGALFLKEHVASEYLACDVVISSDDWISRPPEPVCIGDGSGSEADTKLEEASLSPLPFHDGDYAYADGSLIMDLSEELLGLPMDTV